MSNSLQPMDGSPPGSSAHGIPQARILEWVAISFSRESSQPRDWTQVSGIAGRFFTISTTRKAQSVVSDSLQPQQLYSPWNSSGQNTEVGSLSLFLEIFPTQGLNLGLPLCKWILYQLSHKGSQRILEWVAYPFSSRFSQPRSLTGVSCIAGRFFTNWAIRETCVYMKGTFLGNKPKSIIIYYYNSPIIKENLILYVWEVVI